jgi:hypothetical protein
MRQKVVVSEFYESTVSQLIFSFLPFSSTNIHFYKKGTFTFQDNNIVIDIYLQSV